MRRPAWTTLRETLQPGDVVVVPRIDRLGAQPLGGAQDHRGAARPGHPHPRPGGEAGHERRQPHVPPHALTFCTLSPFVNITSRLSTTLKKRFSPEFTGADFFRRPVKGGGYEVKTDPRDAQIQSRFGGVFQENCTRRPEPEVEELQDLLRRRRQLVEKKVQESGRMDKVVWPLQNPRTTTLPGFKGVPRATAEQR